MDWLWWVGAALVLIVIEIVSLDLVLVMFAGGAFAAAAANGLGAPLWLQIVVFAVASVLLLVAMRPWLLRQLKTRMPLVETNAAAHVGRAAVVVAEVSERGGRIKLAGEVWTARTAVDELRLPAGTEVRVVAIDGATAVVEPADEIPAPRPPARPEHKESA
ncbi:NfeD family protein [Cellulomonas fimi]|uniref:NfeD family protein n=1 Tax=Cellulomonas fimi TaxID=1708 RepID=A0A7Y0LYY4_CELFI|nr:NfeD family protein [Cellulomonas fimi]NMR20756.1 NfeD family protein [Cellulomonas fimi]